MVLQHVNCGFRLGCFYIKVLLFWQASYHAPNRILLLCFGSVFIWLIQNEIIFLEHILWCQLYLDGVKQTLPLTNHLLLKESFSKSGPKVSYPFIRVQHRWSSEDTLSLSRSSQAVSELRPALPFSHCTEAWAEGEHYIKHLQHMWKTPDSSHLQRQHTILNWIL